MYFNQSKMTHNKFVLAVQTLGNPGTFLADLEDHVYVLQNSNCNKIVIAFLNVRAMSHLNQHKNYTELVA